jgi:pimeloyl-ACP methyl ester carboxylesterase
MNVMRILICLLTGLHFGQISSLLGQDLSALVVDVSNMGDGSISQARLEAQRQARSGGLPFRSFTRGQIRTFVGEYTPPELPDDKKDRFIYGLALFSDDGCNVTLKGSSVHARFGRGQHLPNLGQSFHVLPVALVPGETVDITIDYRNTIYAVLPGQPPDIDGLTLFLYLIPVAIAVDANRDGDIVFEGDSRDITSRDKPFRFWINDDDDGRPNDEAEVVPAADEDHADGTMQTMRDLEDFARIHLRLGGLHEQVVDGTFKIGLKFSQAGGGSSKINVYKSADPDGSSSYLTDEKAAMAQISGKNAQSLGEVTSGDPLLLPTDFWDDSSDENATKYLIFEGSSEGQGELVLTIHQSDGTQIAETAGCWLDLKQIKKMYQRGKALPEGIAAPHHSANGPFTGPTASVGDPWNWPFEKDPTEENSAVVFVHGWSMTYDAYFSFTETMFKRLWHQGFKGRFCSFRWDPLVAKEAQLYAGEYNRSEHRALLYGEALRQFVQTVKNDVLDVSLVGHSMGNVVCGSALRQGLIVKNYLLMEAAFPAGCYDESGGDGAVGVNGYDRFWNAELNRPTPDYHDSDMGYRGFLKAMHSNTGRLVNFHNRLDYALATGIKFFWFEANWEKNQVDYKPDGSGTAIHASDWQYLYNTAEADTIKKGLLENIHFVNSNPVWAFTRHVHDSYEIKAFISRPRSKALGAVDSLLANRPAIMEHVNLNAAPYNFDDRESDHSGQFNRRIQEVSELYRDIAAILKP